MFAQLPVQVTLASPHGATLGRVLRSFPVAASPVVITLSTGWRFSPVFKIGPLASFVDTVVGFCHFGKSIASFGRSHSSLFGSKFGRLWAFS